jgi:hypothetical protein
MIITTHDPQTALADYGNRWGIETLFGALKTRGFCLESTHFTDEARLSKLLALLALAFVWAMKAGLWRHTQQPIRLIKAQVVGLVVCFAMVLTCSAAFSFILNPCLSLISVPYNFCPVT